MNQLLVELQLFSLLLEFSFIFFFDVDSLLLVSLYLLFHLLNPLLFLLFLPSFPLLLLLAQPLLLLLELNSQTLLLSLELLLFFLLLLSQSSCSRQFWFLLPLLSLPFLFGLHFLLLRLTSFFCDFGKFGSLLFFFFLFFELL